jgi:hypothetical protein
METITEKRIKCFKRILKELGLYSAYIRERRRLRPLDNVFSVVERHKSLPVIIDYSFTWNDTDNSEIWSELCDISGYSPFHTEEVTFFATKEGLDYLKSKMKICYGKNFLSNK